MIFSQYIGEISLITEIFQGHILDRIQAPFLFKNHINFHKNVNKFLISSIIQIQTGNILIWQASNKFRSVDHVKSEAILFICFCLICSA